ncbi:MAG TPA: hypothetical protein VIL44_02485 [Micromonospora sp.]|jgi:hypothetical protein
MPAPSRSTRAVLACAAVGALLASAGCQALSDASQVIGRSDLVNDLAARLDRSSELTYSIDYRLPESRSATIAQTPQPQRSAYIYPGGRLIITEEAITECQTRGGRETCTIHPPPSPGARPPSSYFTRATEHGLVTPTLVISLLTAAALDAEAVIEQHDTTIAGRHATCVTVRQVEKAAASNFDTCITTEGVLGSFTGVVQGTSIDIAMSHYRDTVDPEIFEVPKGAEIVDRRTSAAAR